MTENHVVIVPHAVFGQIPVAAAGVGYKIVPRISWSSIALLRCYIGLSPRRGRSLPFLSQVNIPVSFCLFVRYQECALPYPLRFQRPPLNLDAKTPGALQTQEISKLL